MGQYTIGAGDPVSGGGYAGIVGNQNQTTNAKRGIVVRDESGKILNDIEYRTAQGRGDKLTAAWEEDAPEAPAEAPEAPAAPAYDPPPPTTDPGPVDPAGGGTPAMRGLMGAMRDPAAGWADESMSMRSNANGLGNRTPPQAVTALSEVMRRFGRTY